jgi:hypothetical protein
MDIDIAKALAGLFREKKEAEARLRTLKEQIARLEPLVLDEMRSHQMDKLSLDEHTLYIHRILIAKPKGGREEVIGALHRCGLDDLLSESYNANTLSAWVRDMLANGEELPAALLDAVETEEIVSVRGRQKASSPESKSAAALKTLEKNHE